MLSLTRLNLRRLIVMQLKATSARSSNKRRGGVNLGSKLMAYVRDVCRIVCLSGRGVTALLSSWVREQSRRSVACRECDMKVSISETVCPRCGAADPARIPMSAVTAIFAICACIVLAMFVFG